MFKRIALTALAIGLTGIAPAAHALASCAPRDGMVKELKSLYKEELTARGLQSADALIEIFTSTETGSYTVLLSRPDGVSCIVSSGTHWLTSEPEPEGVKG